MEMGGYVLFDHAIKELESLMDESTRRKFIATVDLHNTRYIKTLVQKTQTFGILKEVRSVKLLKSRIESVLKLLDEAIAIRKEQQRLALNVVDKLVQENRVQKDPAARIKRALTIFFSGEADVTHKIEEEIGSLDTSNEMAGKYVVAVSHFKTPKPSLKELRSISGFSRPAWSQHLKKDYTMLLTIKGKLGKKLNFAKSEERKEFWIEAAEVVDQKITEISERMLRNRQVTKDMSQKALVTSDRRRSLGGKGLQYMGRHPEDEGDPSQEDTM